MKHEKDFIYIEIKHQLFPQIMCECRFESRLKAFLELNANNFLCYVWL